MLRQEAADTRVHRPARNALRANTRIINAGASLPTLDGADLASRRRTTSRCSGSLGPTTRRHHVVRCVEPRLQQLMNIASGNASPSVIHARVGWYREANAGTSMGRMIFASTAVVGLAMTDARSDDHCWWTRSKTASTTRPCPTSGAGSQRAAREFDCCSSSRRLTAMSASGSGRGFPGRSFVGDLHLHRPRPARRW